MRQDPSSRSKTTSSGYNLACFQQSLHWEIQSPKPLSPTFLILRSDALWSLPPAAAQLPARLSQMPSLELYHILHDNLCLRMSSCCLVVHQEMAQGNLLVIRVIFDHFCLFHAAYVMLLGKNIFLRPCPDSMTRAWLREICRQLRTDCRGADTLTFQALSCHIAFAHLKAWEQ